MYLCACVCKTVFSIFRSDDKSEPKKEGDSPAKDGEKAATDSKEAPKEDKSEKEEKMEH